MNIRSLLLIGAGSLLLAGCSSTNAPVSDMHHGDAMTMGDMVQALEGKTGESFDLAFVEGMIPHHQGAIDMAQLALKNAKHEEVKKMARDIIETQQKEIDMMKQWKAAWTSK